MSLALTPVGTSYTTKQNTNDIVTAIATRFRVLSIAASAIITSDGFGVARMPSGAPRRCSGLGPETCSSPKYELPSEKLAVNRHSKLTGKTTLNQPQN